MKSTIGILLSVVLAAGAGANAARDLSRQAAQLYAEARYAEAEPLFRQALAAWKQLGPEGARGLSLDQRTLGTLLRATGRYCEAEKLLTESLGAFEAAAELPEIAESLFSLAALYRAEGDLAKAEMLALRAAAMLEGPSDAPEAVRRNARLILGSIYVEQRRFAEAESVFRAALEGADGVQAVAAYTNLALIANARGAFVGAESLAREALRLARLSLPPNHPTRAVAWNNLAQACRFRGLYLEAENDYREAIDAWETALGPWHPDLAKGLMNFGSFYHDRGRESGAEDLLNRAAAIFERTFGSNDPWTLVARNELADVLRAERRYTESGKLARATLAALEKALPPEDPRVVRALANYTRFLSETNRTFQANRSRFNSAWKRRSPRNGS